MLCLDEIDINILKYLSKLDEHVTTTEMAKEIFDIKSTYQLRTKDNFIRRRFTKLVKADLVEIDEIDDNTSGYFLSDNCEVISGALKISINDQIFNGIDTSYLCIFRNGHLVGLFF